MVVSHYTEAIIQEWKSRWIIDSLTSVRNSLDPRKLCKRILTATCFLSLKSPLYTIPNAPFPITFSKLFDVHYLSIRTADCQALPVRRLVTDPKDHMELW